MRCREADEQVVVVWHQDDEAISNANFVNALWRGSVCRSCIRIFARSEATGGLRGDALAFSCNCNRMCLVVVIRFLESAKHLQATDYYGMPGEDNEWLRCGTT